MMAGRKAIPQAIRLRLFAASSGHCQRPDCLKPLFPAELGGEKHIAEMAHVIPHGQKGPRHQDRPTKDFEPDSFENLVLLCPSCHTIVDKAPENYPRALLLSWKEEHSAKLAMKQGIRAYDSRGEVREAVIGPLAENKAIWRKFAPVDGSHFEYNPESDFAELWSQRVKSIVLPNHYRIQSIIDVNAVYLIEEEWAVYADYKEHVRGLAARHICGADGDAILFPPEMDKIFE